MKHPIILLIAFTFITSGAYPQAPLIQWQKCLGGSRAESGYSIQQTRDGGYIIMGSSNSNDGNVTGNHGNTFDAYTVDFWVVKTTQTGTIQWQRSIGGGGTELYVANIMQTSDGGYIFAGGSDSNDGDIIGNHLDSLGNRTNDMVVVKLDSNGSTQWQKAMGGSKLDIANAIQQTADGGYILVGETWSNDGDVSGNHTDSAGHYGSDMWIVKLYSSGSIDWQKCLGGSETDWASRVQQTMDGGYIVAGVSYSDDGNVTGNHKFNGHLPTADYWVVKLTNAGIIQWQKSLGGSTDNGSYGTDIPSSIFQTPDSGYIVAGASNSVDGDITNAWGKPSRGYWIVKLTSNGTIVWDNAMYGSATTCTIPTSDGGYIVAGSLGDPQIGNLVNNQVAYIQNIGGSDFLIYKLDNTGNIKWQQKYGGLSGESPSAIVQTYDGGYALVGSTTSNDGDVSGNHLNTNGIPTTDFWIVKLGPDGPSGIKKELTDFVCVYPNPSKGRFTIGSDIHKEATITVYDLSGMKILSQIVPSLSQSVIDLTSQSQGTYLINIVSAENSCARLLTIQ